MCYIFIFSFIGGVKELSIVVFGEIFNCLNNKKFMYLIIFLISLYFIFLCKEYKKFCSKILGLD